MSRRGGYYPKKLDGIKNPHYPNDLVQLLDFYYSAKRWANHTDVMKIIQEQTTKIVSTGLYICGRRRLELSFKGMQYAALNTELLTEKKLMEDIKYVSLYQQPIIRVMEADFLDLACLYAEWDNSASACVVMCVHPCLPGGVFLEKGEAYSDGCEEECYRRTTLLNNAADIHTFNKYREWMYQIPEFGGVYAPKVWIFRGNERRGYPLFPRPICAHFVLITPVNKPKMEPGTRNLMRKFSEKVEKKIRIALQIAKQKKHRRVIIAGPCFCNKCPPWHVAEIIKGVIRNYFMNIFEEIVICSTPGDWNAKYEKFDNIKRVFDNNPLFPPLSPSYPRNPKGKRFFPTRKMCIDYINRASSHGEEYSDPLKRRDFLLKQQYKERGLPIQHDDSEKNNMPYNSDVGKGPPEKRGRGPQEKRGRGPPDTRGRGPPEKRNIQNGKIIPPLKGNNVYGQHQNMQTPKAPSKVQQPRSVPFQRSRAPTNQRKVASEKRVPIKSQLQTIPPPARSKPKPKPNNSKVAEKDYEKENAEMEKKLAEEVKELEKIRDEALKRYHKEGRKLERYYGIIKKLQDYSKRMTAMARGEILPLPKYADQIWEELKRENEGKELDPETWAMCLEYKRDREERKKKEPRKT